MLHYPHHHQVITKPEFPAFYNTACSLPSGSADHDAPPPLPTAPHGLMLAQISASGGSMNHVPVAVALQNGGEHAHASAALSPPQQQPQHSAGGGGGMHRHKRPKRAHMESMSSVDEDQESLQVSDVTALQSELFIL